MIQNPRRLWISLVLVLILLWILSLASVWYYTEDDAFITFRYARHLVAGEGLVFNSGERVEGYSNLLWALIIATGFLFGWDPEVFSKSMAMVFSLVLLPVMYLLAMQQLEEKTARERKYVLLLLSLLVLLGSSSFALWSMAGLETALYTLLLSLATYLFLNEVTKPESKQNPFSAILFFALTITRPEGVIFFLVALLLRIGIFVGLPSHRSFKGLVVWFGLFTILEAGFLVWRFSYYGDFVTNTFGAKVVGNYGEYAVIARAVSGGRYIRSFVSHAGGAAFFAIGTIPLLLSRRMPNIRLMWLYLAISVQLLFVLFVGSDVMVGYRFLVPVLPFIALLVARGMLELFDLLAQQIDSPAPLCYVKKMALVAVGVSIIVFTGFVDWSLVRSQTLHQEMDVFRTVWGSIAVWLSENFSPTTRLALSDAGIIPYVTDFYTLDLYGLNDKEIAKMKANREWDSTYVFDKKPDVMLLREPLDERNCVRQPDTVRNFNDAVLREPTFQREYSRVAAYRINRPGTIFSIYMRKALTVPLAPPVNKYSIDVKSLQVCSGSE